MERKRDDPQSAINVTPLVDVCLVLLIIFMVVAPMLDRHDVRLPQGRNPATSRNDPARIVLTLRVDGTTWYRESWLPPREMTAKLGELHERTAVKELVLQADARLPFSQVRRTMRLVQEAGFSGVSLAATRER